MENSFSLAFSQFKACDGGFMITGSTDTDKSRINSFDGKCVEVIVRELYPNIPEHNEKDDE